MADAASRGRYATDASIYQVEPLAVLVPASDDDVRAAIEVCAALRRADPCRAAPAARNAGRRSARRSSSTTASTSTASSRSTPHAQTVTVEPGIVLDALNALAAPARPVVPGRRQHVGAVHARRHGRQQLVRLALARATATWCTTSSRSMRGSPTAPRRGSDRSATMDDAPPRVRDARSRRCARSATRERDEIARVVPQVMRRVGGYNVDVFNPQSERPYTRDGSVNFAHLLVGSEGTLAWTRTLTLQLAPLPRHRALGVVNFASLHRAMACDARTSSRSGRRRSSSSIAR